MRKPPRIAKALLGRCVPRGLFRDSVLGDLEEGFYRLLRQRGGAYAATWYWFEASRVSLRYVFERAIKRRCYGQAHRSRPSLKNLLESTVHDFRVGARALFRQPGSTMVSIVALGLGIGLCTTMFSIIYGVYGRGVGVPESERLVVISRNNPSQNIARMDVPQHDLYDWREQQRSFEGLAGLSTGTMNLSDTGDPERFGGAFVTANIFELLRVRPILGSTFREGDDRAGAPLTVVLGYDVWANRYGRDPDVVGRAVRVNGEQGTIIGVMPDGFLFPAQQRLWVPQRDERATNARASGPQLQVLGRLRHGVTLDEARVEMSLIAQRLKAAHPEANAGVGVVFNTIVEMSINSEVLPVLVAMQVATVFVLLIACANVTNLLLARAALSARDAAIRTATGANRFRVALPFFSETSILAVAGAALGVAISYVSLEIVNRATVDVGKPYFMVLTVDLPILGFVVLMALLTALFCGAAPAFQISRADVTSILKDEGGGSSGFRAKRLSKLFVIGEIAMSCALLAGAGLMTKSIVNLRSQEFSFATDNIFTARVGLFETDFPSREDRLAFFRDLHESLVSIPRAKAVALTDALPAAGAGSTRFGIEGETYASDHDYPRARVAVVTPGLFHTFGAPVSRGRDISVEDDAEAPPVVVINQSFAERFFPGENPIGRRIRAGTSDSQDEWSTIVGIVPDLCMEGFNLGEGGPAGFYVPLAQSDRSFLSIAVQVEGGNPLSITQEVRAAVRSVHSDTPIYWVRDMPEVIRQGTWFYNLFGGMFIAFGLAALFLASVGLYGVLAFSVSRRVREMGIRMALGANARDVIRLVLREGMLQIAVGLVIGLGFALATSTVLSTFVFEVQPRDPSVFTTIVAVIITVGLFASYVPAHRATRVDPMQILRHE
ncbi:MAG: ABC transporter permease [Gemmatimonadota bacterium]|nr:MAG: ABC transporter permease [Gemmatimonadota bacterium]